MKLFSFITVAIILIGCNQTTPSSGEQNKKTIDSLTTVIQQKDLAYDSLKTKFKSWVIHTYDTENHCMTFAGSVQKNPSNSVFIVGWLKREFSWTHDVIWKKK